MARLCAATIPYSTMIQLILIVVSFCAAESSLCPRNVVKVLTVDNGGEFGEWTRPQFCAKGAFAVGYSMKIEPSLGEGDDTALNAVELHCEMNNTDGVCGGDVTSGRGPWGTWYSPTKCSTLNLSPPKQTFLTSFSLQVEERQGDGDDTTANYIKFKCRDLMHLTQPYEKAAYPGHGVWGTFGRWSASCDAGSAICGIRTKVEIPQCNDDDAALNDVLFYCCND